jgi:hypothetical protein
MREKTATAKFYVWLQRPSTSGHYGGSNNSGRLRKTGTWSASQQAGGDVVCRGRKRHVVCSFRDRKLGHCAGLKDVTLPSGTMVANKAARSYGAVSRAAGMCMHISNAMAGNTMDRPWSRLHQPYASQLSARQPHDPQPHPLLPLLLFIPCRLAAHLSRRCCLDRLPALRQLVHVQPYKGHVA